MDIKAKPYVGPGAFTVIMLIGVILPITVVVLVVRYYQSSKENKDNYSNCDSKAQIRENFPASVTSANVLYTDQDGNLGATSDVGINYLTVASGTKLSGGTTINGGSTLNGGATVNNGLTVNGGITTDTLNSTTSISSPTITDLQNKINTINTTLSSLQSQITTNTQKLSSITNDGNGNIKVTGNISSTKNISAGNALQFGGNYWSLTNISAGTIRFTRVDGAFADFYLVNCGGNSICGTQGF